MGARRIPALLALAIVVAGLLAAATARATLVTQRRDDGRATAAAHAAYLQSRLRETAAGSAALAASDAARVVRRASTAAQNGAKGLVLTGADGRVAVEAIPIPGLGQGDDLDAHPVVGPLLGRAVDRGAQAGGPILVDGSPVVIGVAARFAGAVSEGAAPRRGSASGFAVLLYAVDLTAGDLPVELTGPGGQTAGTLVGDPLMTEQLTVGGRVWQVAYGAPPAPSAGLPLGILLGSIVAAAGAALAALALERRRSRAQADAALRDRQLSMIKDAGARLQQSLDLGELLPTVAVTLIEDFGFGLVDISLADGDGRPVSAFRIGARREAPDAPDVGPVPAGHRLLLPLRRGWRVVGTIETRTERRLDEVERTALQALTDLLAVAVTNAQLLQRERDATLRLRDLDALKNAFLGTVSHELRTSMTAITGFGDVLTDNWDTFDDERRRDIAGRIKRNARSLKHLVDDLLDFARLEQRRLAVNPRSIDLAALGRDLGASMHHLVGERRLDVRADESVVAWVDPFAVERIVANLLSNAGKYSPDGSTITMTVEAARGRARLTVDDQGPGVPREERQRIFTRFYRREDDATVRTKGAGIGLAILADFADSSAASVTVGEAPGGGARFVVDFPMTEPTPGQADARLEHA